MTKMDWNKWIQVVGGRLIQISVACRINFATKLYMYIYIYSEYDINSQHQTTKISADSCWLPPGESTMLHQFRQTWHEHAWQSIDNSIYNIYTYIYLSVKTAYIIKRVCNEVTSPHEIDLTYQTMSLKQAWPQVNQMICAEMRLRQVW